MEQKRENILKITLCEIVYIKISIRIWDQMDQGIM